MAEKKPRKKSASVVKKPDQSVEKTENRGDQVLKKAPVRRKTRKKSATGRVKKSSPGNSSTRKSGVQDVKTAGSIEKAMPKPGNAVRKRRGRKPKSASIETKSRSAGVTGSLKNADIASSKQEKAGAKQARLKQKIRKLKNKAGKLEKKVTKAEKKKGKKKKLKILKGKLGKVVKKLAKSEKKAKKIRKK